MVLRRRASAGIAASIDARIGLLGGLRRADDMSSRCMAPIPDDKPREHGTEPRVTSSSNADEACFHIGVAGVSRALRPALWRV